ncbi:putative hydroxypyruvate isomerase isoform X2 [Scaptodrosophila lebanonensis]|uniref:Hydroxypyruvate isomerase isoform X2 n=1 Tax=Drosophila lebanonensis TaxID=7225 RepID=A0A6J2U436_DROLE|nr:putative hydroxypyruvate isomerase isoform X2 [Scaptodrosophila lebanonensis]
MTLRFAANLNFLFGESSTSIAERIRKAHIYGFKAVEIPYPEHEVDDVVKATNETGICVSLINIALAYLAIKEISNDNIKLMVDFYHLQHIRGNVTKALEEYQAEIGHFQIAQVPNRNEPDTQGELNYRYIFEKILELDYDGWIGCEYTPKATTVEGLNWISKYGLTL